MWGPLNPNGFPVSMDTRATYDDLAPDGTQLAFIRNPGGDTPVQVVVKDVTTLEETVVADGDYGQVALWTPDGGSLILTEIAPTGETLADVLGPNGIEVSRGDTLATIGPETVPVRTVRLVQLDLATGEITPLTEPFPAAYDVSWGQVNEDVIYVAVVPDGTAYVDTQVTDVLGAVRDLMPIIYAVDPATGAYAEITRGWQRWTPFPDAATADVTLAEAPPRLGETCPGGTVPIALVAGDSAYLPADETANNVRSGPDVSNASVGQITPGAWVNVLDGPVCVDGLAWWQVEIPGSVTGWTVEGAAGERWLELGCPFAGCG